MENPLNTKSTSSSSIGKPKRKLPLQVIIASVALFLLVVGGGIAFYLSTQSQDIRQQASVLSASPAAKQSLSNRTPTPAPREATQTARATATPTAVPNSNNRESTQTTRATAAPTALPTATPTAVNHEAVQKSATQTMCYSPDSRCAALSVCGSTANYKYPNESSCKSSVGCGYEGMPSCDGASSGCYEGKLGIDKKCSKTDWLLIGADSSTCPAGGVLIKNSQGKTECYVQNSPENYCKSTNITNPSICLQYNKNYPIGTADSQCAAGVKSMCPNQQSLSDKQSLTDKNTQSLTDKSSTIKTNVTTTTNTPNSNTCVNSDKQGVAIAKYIKFTCNACSYTTGSDGVQAWRCNDNPQEFTGTAPTLAAGQCGQVDQIDGTGAFCGISQINCDGSCRNTPPSSPTPPPVTPTPGVGPVCMNVTISKPNPAVGDSVTFTCGLVAGVNHYEFRVKLPNGTIQPIASTSNVSSPFTIASAGSHTAQCRICTGADASTCQAYGSL